MKAAIIYQSVHHKNTEKVVKTMAKHKNVDLFKVSEANDVDFSGYDYIGLASGIYAASMHKSILNFAKNFELGENQKLFCVFTATLKYADYTKKVRKMLVKRPEQYAGEFWCKGYNTFAIFGLLGGAAKNHPDEKDLKRAKIFIWKLLREEK